MSAPSAAIHGRGMWLNCSFDLESDELYSVKWYKNDTEFYRYIPRDRPPAQNYDLPGVVVDMSRSREGHVFISSVNLSSEGNYRCEASAEAPSFQTVVGEKEIKVFVIPDHPPMIRGTRAKYEVGERVDVSCRAPYSLPAAKLVWHINDQEVPFSDVHELETLYDSEGLQSSAVLLSFVVQPYHMIGSSLRLKCVSIISEAFLTSSEELIVGDTVPSIPYPEASPHSPRIDGGLPKYRINDLVNLTCKSAEYDRPPELKWFINDKEPEHFEDERMHLRCTVTLSNVLNTSSAEASIKNKHRAMSGFRAASKDGACLLIYSRQQRGYQHVGAFAVKSTGLDRTAETVNGGVTYRAKRKQGLTASATTLLLSCACVCLCLSEDVCAPLYESTSDRSLGAKNTHTELDWSRSFGP
ncbi:hypothetical protein HPB50_013461 [Hyalomma asiaticum]|uniref:Uncharacterized protein n=1 Tax=Hyalomma asiaticum TaxID=266040 RepID=A0ACB7S657_HYAAI|nr:hypothetical protein HPB50_013461 [Hyalomma asiaticum]